ncbi:odorant receptor 10-like [Prorops nasuta]|uniref:odorant receptor 10-like n=1 Tax=Prorops nasuta TaxID=863751 RepID=UPI0034CE4CEC
MTLLPLLGGSLMGSAKAIVLFCNIKEVKILLDELQYDWKYFGHVESELSIIKKYAFKGKFITILYAGSIQFLVVFNYLLSCIAPVLDLIAPLNESRRRILIFPGEYYGQNEEHFFLILTIEWYGILCAGHFVFTVDTLYMTLMFHSCGMFAVLSQRLEKLKFQNFKAKRRVMVRSDIAIKQEEKIYLYLSECVELHLKSIKFAERLNSTFNVAFITDLVIGVLIASVSAVKFVLSIDNSDQRMKYGLLYFTQSMRIFLNSFPGQLLIDHSSYIYIAASKNRWYELPEKSKRLLLIMMMRSANPSKFIVAKIFLMNRELFSKVTRTCLSYCTVLLSIQHS